MVRCYTAAVRGDPLLHLRMAGPLELTSLIISFTMTFRPAPG